MVLLLAESSLMMLLVESIAARARGQAARTAACRDRSWRS